MNYCQRGSFIYHGTLQHHVGTSDSIYNWCKTELGGTVTTEQQPKIREKRKQGKVDEMTIKSSCECIRKTTPPENYLLWKLPACEKCPPAPPIGKIIPNEIPSPLTYHTNERKDKTTKFFAFNKAAQYIILIKITKVLFDTQMITGLTYFLYRVKEIQKLNESKNHQVAFTCQLYKSRRTKTRQNWQIGETTK